MSTEQSLSVIKAISVLSAVGSASTALSTSEIVARVGLGKTAVLRILATLTAHDMLERDAHSNNYRIGNAFVMLAQTSLLRHPLIVRASALLEELVTHTEDNGLIMVRHHDKSLCIDVKTGKFHMTLGTDIGTRSPIHCGGGPFALLAFAPDDFVEEYLSKPLEACTPKSVTDPKKIWARIHEARERGYTIGDEDLFEYVVAIGLPIYDPAGKLMGSISVGSINLRYQEPRRQEVVKAILDISRKFFSKMQDR